jgi:hypothetical protein
MEQTTYQIRDYGRLISTRKKTGGMAAELLITVRTLPVSLDVKLVSGIQVAELKDPVLFNV